jgi:hypothetical protein
VGAAAIKLPIIEIYSSFHVPCDITRDGAVPPESWLKVKTIGAVAVRVIVCFVTSIVVCRTVLTDSYLKLEALVEDEVNGLEIQLV